MTTIASDGRRIVRIREKHNPMGFFDLILWIVTDTHGRKPLAPKFMTRKDAFRWATEQGWVVLGSQEP